MPFSFRSMASMLSATILAASCTQQPAPQEEAAKPVAAGESTIQIDAANVLAEVQPTMYGIFFEDINFAADGGIYAEMVKNRSFEFTIPDIGWSQPQSDKFSMNDKSGFASIIKKQDGSVNPHFMRVTSKSASGYCLTNEGFRGMGVKEGAQYDLSIQVRVQSGSPKLKVELADEAGKSLGSAEIVPSGSDWKEYTASIVATGTAMKGKLNIWFDGESVTDVDMISMFPKDTWMGRPKGMRKDLVQLLYDLKPGFLRFPGGCIVEGRTLERRYQWKKTVGDIEDREVLVNRWNTEFSHRPTPDYYQSFGLGFFEYFQLSEDLGAEPLPILGCGMACQFNTGELVPMDELEPYIADALDLIEFANGAVTTKWGKLRAAMGHPEPFDMKYIGIGNEQWGPEYITRYLAFEKEIRAKYPDIIIVSGSGPFPDGEMFEYGWEELKKLNAQIVDEHYYRSPEWFLQNADRYDSYDKNGPKVFAGEYASQSVAIASPDNKNNWQCALSEAAFMTGLERNADVVYLTSYAPLFAHAEGWQWTPDLIWFNNLQSYGTANYYVQKLYSNNPGTHVLNTSIDGKPVIGQAGIYASTTKDESTGELILKVVNTNAAAHHVNLNVAGVAGLASTGNLQVLSNAHLEQINSFDEQSIQPVSSEVAVSGSDFSLDLQPYSMNVLRVKMN